MKGMKSLTRSEIATGLSELASKSIKNDYESPFHDFHENCVMELRSESSSDKATGKSKAEEEDSRLFHCTKCGSDPCKWVCVGEELHPTIHELNEQNGGITALTNAQIRFLLLQDNMLPSWVSRGKK